jgi:DNA-binding protein HU-beta
MNKAQLIEEIVAQTELPRTQVETTLNSAFEFIKKSVKKGEDVTLVGFGTFTKSKRQARTGRNPQTGMEIQIPEMMVPKFRPGKDFKALIQ